MNLKEREAQVCTIIDGMQDELKSISLFLHNNPELGQQEVLAVDKISQYMMDNGFDTTVGLTERLELRTAMRCDIGTNRLHKIAFLGEYDALPELGHGCGHNLIAIMSMGAAIAFSQTSRETWGTTFFGCPAEETIGGKVYMAEEGLFKGYDGALIIHPGGENEVGGTSLATHPLEVTFRGRSCHIASLTDSGINALDCAVDLYQSIKQMKTNTFPKGAIVGAVFTQAGTAPNVVTDKATLRMTVRGATVADLEDLILPAFTLALPRVAMTTRLLRSSLLSEEKKDYTRTAYSRGNTVSGVLYHHVLRNAILPVINFYGMTLSDLVAGSIVIEKIFKLPGISTILITSIQNRDYPVVEGILMGLTLYILLVNFMVDMIGRAVDPRVDV